MQEIDQLSEQVTQRIKASSLDTATATGPKGSAKAGAEQADRTTQQKAAEPAVRAEVIAAVDQMFAEFELIYHNQFHKAYADEEQLYYAKKLWFSYLQPYSAERILRAVHILCQKSAYLPTLHSLLSYCEPNLEEFNLPEVKQAYLEACLKPTPKAEQNWSHPAVYFAAQRTGWFFLANNPESLALPRFEQQYQQVCQQVMQGEGLPPIKSQRLPDDIHRPLSKKQQRTKLAALRKSTGL